MYDDYIGRIFKVIEIQVNFSIFTGSDHEILARIRDLGGSDGARTS
jgi:hypothetical protein